MTALSKVAKDCAKVAEFTEAVKVLKGFGKEFGAISAVLMIGAELLGAKSKS
jgi:hypothetical protein